ncbi:MAG: helix-turn-helix domain-containing protein, partial [Acidobacteria bacterium]|nr:helix-turn-helix domain-containing protein [Acidobacteriota bacterium]
MHRRPPRDGETPAVSLPQACRDVGVELAEWRAYRGLSVEDIASPLILSKRQVLALERMDLSAFYNPAYYLKA